jgi:hypothetical protein
MQDFVVDDAEYSRSIGFDATNRDGLVVTVGVSVNRTQEALLLDTLYRELHSEGYLPFRTKSRDLSVPPEKIESVLLNCRGEVGICIHQDSVKLPYAEAVHSAIILDELAVPTNKSIVIVDGDESKAALFHYATGGVDVVPSPVVHCTRSELYYPHLLLADLIAGWLADQIESSPRAAYDWTPTEPVSVIQNTTAGGERWGSGYNAAARSEGGVRRPTFEQRYGSSFQERVTCWFHGWFGNQHAHPPASESVSPVAGRLRAIECTEIAQWIVEQQ